MYFCFLDELNTPPKPSKKRPKPYFIISGVIVHENDWFLLDRDLKEVKENSSYRVGGEIKWRFFGPTNADVDNSVAHLSEEKRNQLRKEIYQLLIKRPEITLVSCATNVKQAYEKRDLKDEEDLYHETYKQVSERFQFFLQDTAKQKGRDEAGLMVADTRGRKQDDALRDKHRHFLESDQFTTINYKNFIETVFLSPSHHSTGIQFADMVAGAIGRYFNVEDDAFFRMIEPKFRRGPKNRIEDYGLIQFPK